MSWDKLDPRAKALLAVLWSVALTAVPGPRAWVLLPAALLLLLSAGYERRALAGWLRTVLILWALTVAANAWLVPGERLGPEAWGWLRPTREGLAAGWGQGFRLAALTAVSGWAVAVIGAFELAGSLEWSVRGLPGLRRRVHRAFLPVILALRLLPLFFAEGRRLLEVDRLRHGSGGRLAKLRRMAGLAPLWMVIVIERAEALALALTLRGYRPEGARGFMRRFRFGAWDWGLVGVAVAGVILLTWPGG